MVNHPNRGWRNKWRVDLSACRATHLSGLIVEFKQSDDGGWDGTCPNYQEIFKEINQSAANRFARLMREAGDIYKECLDQTR